MMSGAMLALINIRGLGGEREGRAPLSSLMALVASLLEIDGSQAMHAE